MPAQLRDDGVLPHNAASTFRGSPALVTPVEPLSNRRGALGGPQAMPAASLLDHPISLQIPTIAAEISAISHVPTLR